MVPPAPAHQVRPQSRGRSKLKARLKKAEQDMAERGITCTFVPADEWRVSPEHRSICRDHIRAHNPDAGCYGTWALTSYFMGARPLTMLPLLPPLPRAFVVVAIARPPSSPFRRSSRSAHQPRPALGRCYAAGCCRSEAALLLDNTTHLRLFCSTFLSSPAVSASLGVSFPSFLLLLLLLLRPARFSPLPLSR